MVSKPIFGIILKQDEAGKLALIAAESPQRNAMERGLRAESGETIFK